VSGLLFSSRAIVDVVGDRRTASCEDADDQVAAIIGDAPPGEAGSLFHAACPVAGGGRSGVSSPLVAICAMRGAVCSWTVRPSGMTTCARKASSKVSILL